MLGTCWWSKDQLISNALLWTPIHGHPNVDSPAKSYIHHLCTDIGHCVEDLPRSDDWEGWMTRVKGIHAISTTWSGWYNTNKTSCALLVEVRMNSWVVFSYRLLDMDTLVLADEQGLTSVLCWNWKQSRRYTRSNRGCPRGVMVKAMDCGIIVSEFVLQSRYYVHFRANTLGKGIEPPYPPSYGLNSTTTVLLGEWLWH